MYAELHCHSAFSLLDGASLPEQLVARARALGLAALALTDHDDLGGIVRFAQAAAETGLPGIVGVELTVRGGSEETEGAHHPLGPRSSALGPAVPSPLTHHLVLLAETREGYGNLSTLVTRARTDAPRGLPGVTLDVVAEHAAGLFALTGCPRGLVPARLAAGDRAGARATLGALAEIFGGRVAVECWDHHLPEERALVRELVPLARALALPWVVTNDVHYATTKQRLVHDVLAALRHERSLDEMGTRLRPNAEWRLRSARAMLRRWAHAPEGVRATLAVAERCAFRLEQLRPSLPRFPLPPGVDADEYLRRLVEWGAAERWQHVSDAQRRQLEHELAVIRRMGLAGYFLIVWDIVRFARREGILCQGRGSAANSAVCYCLGITAVDPIAMGLLFERFLSEERREAPDIDLDFAHRERERVLQYVYERYGREHAAMVCEQITWRGRSAVRDAARVLGYSVEQAEELALVADRHSARATAERLRARSAAGEGTPEARAIVATSLGSHLVGGTEAATRAREERARTKAAARDADPSSSAGPPALDPGPCRSRPSPLAAIVEGLHELPRHRSIHVGGFVLTEEPLSRVVPIEPAAMEDRTVIQWEKDDLDPVGLVKIDLLGLGMLTVLQDCLRDVRRTRGVDVDLARLDMRDQAVYDDLCRADTIGVFQVESRAQMNTLPRLKPRCFYDLVVQVALIRPGPIQGEMVHPYLRRRAGLEEVTYPHPSLEPILKRTLGVPLFQEQGMRVAIVAAGFSGAEADELRRSMGHKRSRERMEAISERLLAGMKRNGIPDDAARRIYQQLMGFADYGFPESHAASFALLVYASAYLRHYYTPEFTAAMLNAQPMGFYAPGSIVEDARRHGVVVRPVDLRVSGWDATLEEGRERQGPGPRVEGPERTERPASRAGAGSSPSQRLTSAFPLGLGPSALGPQAPAVRLGLRSVKGLGARAKAKLEAALAQGPFTAVGDVVRRAGLDRRALRALAEAGAFDGFFADEPNERRRRAALWRILDEARGDAGPLAPRPRADEERADARAPVPAMSALELTEADYRLTGIPFNGHPMRHLRELLAPNGVRAAREVRGLRDGERVAVAGLVICRQRPGTAKGFTFLTLEDETGMVNVVVRPKIYERDAVTITRSPLLLVRGVLQMEEGVVNVRAALCRALHADVGAEWAQRHDFH